MVEINPETLKLITDALEKGGDLAEGMSERLQAVGVSWEQITAASARALETSRGSYEYAKSIESTLKEQGIEQTKAVQIAGLLSSKYAEISRTAQDIASKKAQSTLFQQLQDQMSMANISVEQLALSLEPVVGVLPYQGIESFGKFGSEGAAAATGIGKGFAFADEKLGKFLEKIPSLGPALVKFSKRLFEGSEAAAAMERSIIRMAASSGSLEGFGTGMNFGEDLADRATSYIDMTKDIAMATGRSLETAQDFASSLGSEIPGAFKVAEEAADKYGAKMSSVTAAIKVADAFGRDLAETQTFLRDAYRDLGLSGSDALEVFAGIGAQVRDLKIPFDTVQGFVMETAKSFRFLGDNSKGAMDVIDVFGSRFREMGLGSGAISNLMSGMQSGIAGMDQGQKAFISQSTGGAGGLAGAFEIDLLLKEGNFSEVLAKSMQAIQRQFGTGPVTLEDVQRDASLAGELQKQTQFLTDVLGIAGTQQEAFRILEAMQTGAVEELKAPGRDVQRDLLEAVQAGNSFEERHLSMISEAGIITAAATQAQALSGAAIRRVVESRDAGSLLEADRSGGRTPFGRAGTGELISEKEFLIEGKEDLKRKGQELIDKVKSFFPEGSEARTAIESRLGDLRKSGTGKSGIFDVLGDEGETLPTGRGGAMAVAQDVESARDQELLETQRRSATASERTVELQAETNELLKQLGAISKTPPAPTTAPRTERTSSETNNVTGEK